MKLLLTASGLVALALAAYAIRSGSAHPNLAANGSNSRFLPAQNPSIPHQTIISASGRPPGPPPSPEEIRRQEATRAEHERTLNRLVGAAREAVKAGDTDRAARRYREAIAVDGGAFLRLEFAAMLDRADRKADALREYDALFNDRSLGGTYQTSPGVVGRYAALCEKAGFEQKAVELYRRSISWYKPVSGTDLPCPRTDVSDLRTLKAVAQMIQGIEYSGHGQTREELDHYKRAVDIKPDYGLAHLYIAYKLNSLHLPGVPEAYAKAVRYGDAQTHAAAKKLHYELIVGPQVWRQQHPDDPKTAWMDK